MRIQNNITAMNTHRQYTINNDNVAKAAEKLSSGYRINRAADDAAGLAISEKMRSQIRGLNMATKNSQDAISLVQTAEGALQETHSMLQRMNELAVQAATGTNQDFDKIQAAKEFEQLKREINDVAESTTFNNMKILDGSLSYQGFQRSAATAGVTVTATELPDDGQLGMSSVVTTKADNGTAKAAVRSSFKVGISGFTLANNASATVAIGGVNFAYTNTTGNTVSDQGDIAAGLAASNATATIGGVSYDVTSDGTSLVFTASADPTADATTATPTVSVTAGGGNASASDVTDAKAAVPGRAPVKEVSTVAVNPEALQVGDSFTINDKTYTLVSPPTTGAVSTGQIAWDDTKTVQDLVDGINAGAPTGVAVAVSGTGFTVTQSAVKEPGDTGYVPTKTYYKPATTSQKYNNTIEFDTTKMKDGDKFALNIGNQKIEVTYDEKAMATDATKSAAQKMAEAVAYEAGKKGVDVEAKGNAILYTGEKVTETKFELTGAEDNTKTNAVRIQVGALEDEQLAVSIDAMNTKGLGLDGFNLETQNEASMAITAVRDAVNKVSDQRATLGAMQNRLDHKIANLKVSSENLTAAESRIRDVDMASEMTNFTKNNILSQAATAMLAQANALPQNVLSLLG